MIHISGCSKNKQLAFGHNAGFSESANGELVRKVGGFLLLTQI